VFYRDAQNVYRVGPLDQFAWLVHGFGTRQGPGVADFGNLATVHQVHSDVCVAARGRTGVLGDGDALLDNTPGHVVGVKTADCLPILLVDEEHRAVAAVHAGWRGTVRHIVRAAVSAMQTEFATHPARLHVAIGPGIGKCCYQVGPEVAAQFGEAGPCKIDLADANRRALMEAGVPGDQIYAAPLCTMCGVADFHSYRRDRERAGRMLSFAGVK
jgi:purine-nucleoside/S-methyl-5'-thioadenosine phosphorylase / adenosine deaminase